MPNTVANEANNRPKLLIYVHGDRLGDALLKLPAIATIREQFPDHHVTWLAGGNKSIFCGSLKPLISGMVDEVLENAQIGFKWGDLLKPPPLNGAYYDVVIDTQSVVRATLCLRRIKHNLFISSAARFLLSSRRPSGQNRMTGSVQQQLMHLLRLASGKHVKQKKVLPLPAQYRQAASKLLPTGPVYIGMAPGAGDKQRCWPLTRYIEVARQQQSKGRTPVFFLGPEESTWESRIVAEINNACLPEQEAARKMGLTGPLLSLALAERITAGVANDSGSGHILAAAGQPLISLFGPSNPDKFFEPSAVRMLIRAQDYGGKEMANIPAQSVIEAIEVLVDRFAPAQQQAGCGENA